MAGNKSLNAAAKAKQDEFYTQLTDIEKECVTIKSISEGKQCFATVMIPMRVISSDILQ